MLTAPRPAPRPAQSTGCRVAWSHAQSALTLSLLAQVTRAATHMPRSSPILLRVAAPVLSAPPLVNAALATYLARCSRVDMEAESAGVRGCAPRGPCALTLAPRVRRSTTQCGVRPRALRPLRDTALGGMAWLRAVLCQHHWHGGHIQEPCRNVHVHVLTLKARCAFIRLGDASFPFHQKCARSARSSRLANIQLVL